MQLTAVLVFLVLSLVQVAVVKSQQGDIIQTLIQDGQYRILLFALADTGLIEAFRGPGPFTVFAPTDRAFEKLPRDVINDLFRPENRPKLAKLLEFHAVSGKALTAAEIIALNPPFKLKMLNNVSTEITEKGGIIKINNATVIIADIKASNGIIHAIDEVLFPPDVVQTAINDGRFKILVTALKAGDLVQALEGPGPFTVFAPTDAAFGKLPPGTVTDLLKPENKPKLIRILTYHVVAGKALSSADILALKPPVKLEMLNGLTTEVTVSGGDIKVNDATVIVANVIATNGIVHAIDTVLLPAD
jgi:transforming growth factor-beta-induced protein